MSDNLYFRAKNENADQDIFKDILALDNLLEKFIRSGWRESWLHINLPLGSSRALVAIESGNAATPRAVAELLGVGRTTVTGMLDRLEAENLITRSIDPQDRRSFLLLLTPKGRELIRQIDEERQNSLMRGLLLMDEVSQNDLRRGLVALVEALKRDNLTRKNLSPAIAKSGEKEHD